MCEKYDKYLLASVMTHRLRLNVIGRRKTAGAASCKVNHASSPELPGAEIEEVGRKLVSGGVKWGH